MSADLREAIGRYLDHAATPAEIARVEAALLDDAAARIFAEELLLRDLLRHAPPEVPPAEVIARWEAAILGELDEGEAPSWFGQTLELIGWSIRGPALSMSGGSELARVSRDALRYSMPSRTPPKPKAWWRRALGVRLPGRKAP